MNSCPFIDKTILFTEKTVAPCYAFLSKKIPLYLDKAQMDNEKVCFKQKKEEFNQIINGPQIDNYSCKSCSNLNRPSTGQKKYDHFIISLWNENIFEYDFFEMIDELYNHNLIDTENLVVEFQSRDFLTIAHLEKIINIFTKNGCKEIKFMMNNIVYLPIIEKILKEGKGSMYIVLDFKDDGKLVEDKYGPQHILRSYLVSAKDKNSISVHYNLRRGINDTDTDIKKFINTMFRIGVNKIGINLDNKDIDSWIQRPIPLNECPAKISELILLFFKLARKHSFFVDMSYDEQNIVFRKIFKTHLKKEIWIKRKIKRIFKNIMDNKDNF